MLPDVIVILDLVFGVVIYILFVERIIMKFYNLHKLDVNVGDSVSFMLGPYRFGKKIVIKMNDYTIYCVDDGGSISEIYTKYGFHQHYRYGPISDYITNWYGMILSYGRLVIE
jgi:hypothetical protein